MAHQGPSGDYWAYDGGLNGGQDGSAGAGGGFSPLPLAGPSNGDRQLHRTASEEVQQALGGGNGYGQKNADPFAGRSSTSYSSFDPLDNARLSPSAFDPSNFNKQFVLPRFASGGDPFGLGVGITDPPSSSREIASPMPFEFNYINSGQTPRAEQPSQPSPFYQQPSYAASSPSIQAYGQPRASKSGSVPPHQQQQQRQHPQQQQQQQRAIPPPPHNGPLASTSSAGPYIPPPPQPSIPQPYIGGNGQLVAPTSAELESPIYAPYGSSVISVNATPNALYKLPALAVNLPPSQPGVQEFNPSELGLPAPPPTGSSNNFAGLYSASGFDMLGVLARVAARPNPQIQIGPVDMSCAFAVVDARRYDQPLVFVSDTFVKMTGYTNEEIIGRNCRFLQSPGGGTIQGAPRKYTDGNAAWHMRQHIQAGKESQSSLINYTKGGRPFINLVTIIPICWDTEEIAYFVGFQVDLVDQPNAILNRMRDGSYVVNYSLVGSAYNLLPNPSLLGGPAASDESGKTVSMRTLEMGSSAMAGGMAGRRPEPDEWAIPEDGVEGIDGDVDGRDDSPPVPPTANSAPQQPRQSLSQSQSHRASISSASSRPSQAAQMAGVGGEPSTRTDDELLDQVMQQGIESLELEVDKRAFHKMLLSEADDFVHVLSLKGSVLYCSPSVERVLEYEPGELVGSTISSLCHPSDVVPVMRLLKDASSIQNPHVKLLYRIRRKYSGYLWIEATGKLHIEPGKGRKCVIAIARPRDVTQMGWNELRRNGGLGDTEFFLKVGERGTVLFATATLQSVLGFAPDEAVGCSLMDLALPEYSSQLEIAIQQAQLGVPADLQYKLKNRKGVAVDVVTRFYPRHPEVPDNALPPHLRINPVHTSILAQTNELGSENRKAGSIFSTSAPVYSGTGAGVQSPAISDSGSNSGSSNNENSTTGGTAFQSTFKTLAHPSSISDNVFDELETRRPTSWQFELHQMQNLNKKLRDEKDYLLALGRKRGSGYSERSRKGSAASDTGSRASSNTPRVCQNCGRTDSPEWRSGPNGHKTLCNACGLRWAKAQKQAAQGGIPANPAAFNGGSMPSPTSSTGSMLAALAPMTISPTASARQSPQQLTFGLPKVDEDGPVTANARWPSQQQ
ncbi:hypothetical protein JCM10207_002160 [Rhodosporidiobolus poonsookiae]